MLFVQFTDFIAIVISIVFFFMTTIKIKCMHKLTPLRKIFPATRPMMNFSPSRINVINRHCNNNNNLSLPVLRFYRMHDFLERTYKLQCTSAIFGRYFSASCRASLASSYLPLVLSTLPRLPSAENIQAKRKIYTFNIIVRS